MKPEPASLVLLRSTGVEARDLAFAQDLQIASGHRVAFVADVRRGPVSAPGHEVVGLSETACRGIGLYCPEEFAWQCGDYGYYLARQQFPEIEQFWMIEYDVRFLGPGARDFFEFFDAQPEVDFLATGLTAADRTWYWTATARARDVQAHRCLFPVTRLSARAVDAAAARRVAHSRSPLRRRLWPNDEALVATTLMSGGFVCRDFNALGRTFYEAASFSFEHPIDGDRPPAQEPQTRMVHPVLFGAAYKAKLAKLQSQARPVPRWRRVRRRLLSQIAGRTRW